MLFCAEVLLVNAREELCGCVCVGGPSFIGGWRTCVLGRRHCSRRQAAALRHPNRGVRRPSLGNLRCCASWAWLGGRSQTRALGLGLRAGGSIGVPTAPPSGGKKNAGVKNEWKLQTLHRLTDPQGRSYVPALRRWSPAWSTACPHWTGAGGSPSSRACGGWRRCRGWRDSWATARGCSRAALGSGPGRGTRAEGWAGWSRTAEVWCARPRTCTTWGRNGGVVNVTAAAWQQTRGAYWGVWCCSYLLPRLLAGARALQVQRVRSWSS